MIQKMLEVIEKHDIHPLIAKVYDFDDAPAAFEALEQGNGVGKLIVKVQ